MQFNYKLVRACFAFAVGIYIVHITLLYQLPPPNTNEIRIVSNDKVLDEMMIKYSTLRSLGRERLQRIVSKVTLKLSRTNQNARRILTKLYVITLTFTRPEQLAELTRLGQTLMHVPNLFWLVVEDSTTGLKPSVTALLLRLPIESRYILATLPDDFNRTNVGFFPSAVATRNYGLKWIRENVRRDSGVVYFADDEHTYDLRFFEEIRSTRRVSIFPVGLRTTAGLNSPIVKDGRLVGFYNEDLDHLKFGVDLMGLAVNNQFLHDHPEAAIPLVEGEEGDGFLRSLSPLEKEDLELKAETCTTILVWRTKSRKNWIPGVDMEKYQGTNLIHLNSNLERDGLINLTYIEPLVPEPV